MPYNNTAIPPSEDSTGAAILPLARVKKAIAADDEIGPVSAQAAFIITKATELFIQHLTEQAFRSLKADSKVKRTLMYRDLASTIARTDNLEFATDLVPQTTTWAAHKEKRNQAKERKAGALTPGQTTLETKRPGSSHRAVQLDNPAPSGSSAPTNGITRTDANGGLIFQHYEPKHPKVDPQGDVDMR